MTRILNSSYEIHRWKRSNKTCSFSNVRVQLLVQRQADLFMENENRETPCDCAEKQHHQELALSLESQMVFSLAPEPEGIEAEYAALDHREVCVPQPTTLSSWCHASPYKYHNLIVSVLELLNQRTLADNCLLMSFGCTSVQQSSLLSYWNLLLESADNLCCSASG